MTELSTTYHPDSNVHVDANKEYYQGDYTPKAEAVKLTKEELETEELLNYKDHRLMHLNPEYSRATLLKNLKIEMDDYNLIEVYDNIFKYNNWVNEYNFILEIY